MHLHFIYTHASSFSSFLLLFNLGYRNEFSILLTFCASVLASVNSGGLSAPPIKQRVFLYCMPPSRMLWESKTKSLSHSRVTHSNRHAHTMMIKRNNIDAITQQQQTRVVPLH